MHAAYRSKINTAACHNRRVSPDDAVVLALSRKRSRSMGILSIRVPEGAASRLGHDRTRSENSRLSMQNGEILGVDTLLPRNSRAEERNHCPVRRRNVAYIWGNSCGG